MSKDSYKSIVKHTGALKKKSSALLNDVTNLQKDFDKFEEKCNCEHIWFVSKRSHDEHFDDSMFYYTCVKCGQIQVLGEQRIGFDETGTEYYANIVCDPEVVINSYQKILANNPEIDDIEAAIELESYIKSYNEAQKAERNRR